jgi:hypothetical protein
MAPAEEEVHAVAFNQDGGCFVCATSKGFRVYNTDPFKQTFCRTFGPGAAAGEAAARSGGGGAAATAAAASPARGGGGRSLARAEMLFRCNILALVGGGPDPAFPPTRVTIWDDHQARAAGELSFRSPVRAVGLRRDAVVVALEHRVLVYAFSDLSLRLGAETLSNPRGLVAVSSRPERFVLACPGLHAGQVRLEHLDRRQTRFVAAHAGPLAALALSADGGRLATASDKGTLVRVWDTAGGELLQELRRGSDPACVGSLALSAGCEWLAAASDKGTVHVWALAPAVRRGAGGGAGASGGGNSGGGNAGPRNPQQQQQQQQQQQSNGVYGAQYGSGDVAGLGAAAGGGRATAAAAADGAAAAGAAADEGSAAAAAAAGSSPNNSGGAGGGGNPTTVLSSVRGLAPILPRYFSSEWSLAQYRVPEPDAGAIVVGFPPAAAAAPCGAAAGAAPAAAAAARAAAAGGDPVLVVLTTGGSYHKVTFNPVKGGPCVPLAVGRYIVDDFEE